VWLGKEGGRKTTSACAMHPVDWKLKSQRICGPRQTAKLRPSHAAHTHPSHIMFKRVDRRRKRKEIEERLGLDDDERGVFGLHDTDSSESESESDASESASSSVTFSDGHRTQPKKMRKRGASRPSNDDESDEDENEGPAADDEEDESGSGEYASALRLSIASALKEPVRLIRTDPEAWVCTFCPGKFLKHAAMVKVHEASRVRTIRTSGSYRTYDEPFSQSHRGRFTRIQELAMEFSPDEDIRTVLAKSATEAQPKGDGTTLSRRAKLRVRPNTLYRFFLTS
jgi:hypothetical protein